MCSTQNASKGAHIQGERGDDDLRSDAIQYYTMMLPKPGENNTDTDLSPRLRSNINMSEKLQEGGLSPPKKNRSAQLPRCPPFTVGSHLSPLARSRTVPLPATPDTRATLHELPAGSDGSAAGPAPPPLGGSLAKDDLARFCENGLDGTGESHPTVCESDCGIFHKPKSESQPSAHVKEPRPRRIDSSAR